MEHSLGDPFSSLFKLCRKINFSIFYEFYSKLSSKVFFSETAGPIDSKFDRNIPWEGLYEVCSNGPEKSNFQFFRIFFLIFQTILLKIFFSEAAGPINIIFDRDTPWGSPSQVCSYCAEKSIFEFFVDFFHIWSKMFLKISFHEATGPVDVIYDRGIPWEVSSQMFPNLLEK